MTSRMHQVETKTNVLKDEEGTNIWFQRAGGGENHVSSIDIVEGIERTFSGQKTMYMSIWPSIERPNSSKGKGVQIPAEFVSSTLRDHVRFK